jgi:hypothetical protein
MGSSVAAVFRSNCCKARKGSQLTAATSAKRIEEQIPRSNIH